MLLAAALKRGLRTIVYTQSRKMTELISLWISERAGPYASRVSAYRSGFLPEERRAIEAAMTSGELLAVVSTSALELGIDIGGLDLCILCGYPGSVMSAWQRGGRVGRALRESAVVMIAGEDALDQYFMRHPADFFDRPPEAAVINPDNPVIAAKHLECAAAELPLVEGEPCLASPAIRRVMATLERQGLLLRSRDGTRLFAARKRPHRDVNLRGSGGQFTIEADGAVIGRIDEMRAYKETHPGAVYIHRGLSYLVVALEIPERRVRVALGKVDYYTRGPGPENHRDPGSPGPVRRARHAGLPRPPQGHRDRHRLRTPGRARRPAPVHRAPGPAAPWSSRPKACGGSSPNRSSRNSTGGCSTSWAPSTPWSTP